MNVIYSSLAALGLVENNAPNIVAAMLVSPLMGPVMAVTFGAMIADKELVVNMILTSFNLFQHTLIVLITSEIRIHCLLRGFIDVARLWIRLWSNSGHHRNALGIR